MTPGSAMFLGFTISFACFFCVKLLCTQVHQTPSGPTDVAKLPPPPAPPALVSRLIVYKNCFGQHFYQLHLFFQAKPKKKAGGDRAPRSPPVGPKDVATPSASW